MPYGLTLTSASENEPLSLSEAKKALKIDHDEWDDEIESIWIPAAREIVERRLSAFLVAQSWKLTLDRFPLGVLPGSQVQTPEATLAGQYYGAGIIELPIAKVRSVDLVKYYSASDVLTTLSQAVYQVDLSTEPARIMPVIGSLWPPTAARMAAVEITVTAGDEPVDVSPMLRAAVLLQMRWLYEENEGLSKTVDALLDLAWDGKRHGPQS